MNLVYLWVMAQLNPQSFPPLEVQLQTMATRGRRELRQDVI